MGFIRGTIVVLLSILLFVSLLASNTSFVLGTSLKYDNVKNGLYPIVKAMSGAGNGSIIPGNVLNNVNITQAVENASTYVNNYCQNNTDYNFSYNGYSINIPCEKAKSIVNSTNPQEALINQTFDSIVSAFYYKQYDCSFTQCFSAINPPLFLVSEMSQQYFMGKFYLALLASLILLALLFFAVIRKANALIISGILLVASSIPVLIMGKVVSGMIGQFAFLLGIFLVTAKTAFWFSIVLGIVLISGGIALRIWGPKSEKEKLSKKEEKGKK